MSECQILEEGKSNYEKEKQLKQSLITNLISENQDWSDGDVSLILKVEEIELPPEGGARGEESYSKRTSCLTNKMTSLWSRMTSSSAKKGKEYFPRESSSECEHLLSDEDGDVNRKPEIVEASISPHARCFADVITSTNERQIIDVVHQHFLQLETLQKLNRHDHSIKQALSSQPEVDTINSDVITVKILQASEFQTMFRSFEQFNATGVTVTSSSSSGIPDYFLTQRGQCAPGVTFSFTRMSFGRFRFVCLRKFRMRNVGAWFIKNVTPDSLQRLTFHPEKPSKSRLGRKLNLATVSGQLMLIPKNNH